MQMELNRNWCVHVRRYTGMLHISAWSKWGVNSHKYKWCIPAKPFRRVKNFVIFVFTNDKPPTIIIRSLSFVFQEAAKIYQIWLFQNLITLFYQPHFDQASALYYAIIIGICSVVQSQVFHWYILHCQVTALRAMTATKGLILKKVHFWSSL